MKKGAVALLALAAMAFVSTPALAAKKGKSAMTVDGCKAFLEQAASNPSAAPAGKSKLTVDGCKEFIAAEEKKAADLAAYRSGFEEAANANDLELFIDMFSGNDPDKLVPKAKAKLKELRDQEAAAAAAAPAAQ